MTRVYLDHNATAAPLPEVVDAVRDAMANFWGNPSAVHGRGQEARRRVDEARRCVAAAMGATPDEIVFTSGGTEANVLALRGVCDNPGIGAGAVVVSPVEHSSIRDEIPRIEASGRPVTRLPVGTDGRIDPDDVVRGLLPGTVLVSIQIANHEIGTIQAIPEIGSVLRDRGILFHVDAVQAFGKIPLDVRELGVDLLSVSSHKIGGPMGCGALWMRRGLELAPLFRGGGQEARRRGGTENLPGIVGFGVACEVMSLRDLEGDGQRLAQLRDSLEDGILERVSGVARNGSRLTGLPNTLSLCIEGIRGDDLVRALDLEGIAVSRGAACGAGRPEPSAVLLAIGHSPERALSGIRLSLGHCSSEDDILQTVAAMTRVIPRLRAI
jgi:cysteine desulfurase